MFNYVTDGKALHVPAPRDVSSGDGVLTGSLFGIARTWARTGELVEIQISGVFEVSKSPEETWVVGQQLSLNKITNQITNDLATGPVIGIAFETSRKPHLPQGRVRIFGFVLHEAPKSIN